MSPAAWEANRVLRIYAVFDGRQSDAAQRSNAIARVCLGLALTALFMIAYSTAGRLATHRVPYDVQTFFDRTIPVLPGTVLVYLSVFPGAFLPLFVVTCPRLLLRSALAYGATILGSTAMFVLFPVHVEPLRAGIGMPSPSDFTGWLLGAIYRADTSANLFPSLHVSLGLLSALISIDANRRWSWPAAVCVVALLVSTWTTKQHYIADGIGGLVIGATAAWVVLASHKRNCLQCRPAASSAIAWYCVFHAGFLLGLYALFRS